MPSRRAARSALVEENDGGTATNSFSGGEMESYQGLVGRPGIDFPVLTHIPKTIFDCKNHGNGYFADLETRCQVFHICDDGKKISFLCPNGTIFRQLDLICDWWFKVDCAATPNHFAESTEMLTQAKRARLQSKHPVPQPITQSDERLTLNIQDKRLLLGNTNSLRTAKTPARNTLELNRRMDRIVSAESNGFGNRNGKTFKDNTDKSYVADEIQETSQSASFASIANKMFNTYYAQEQLLKDQANGNKLRRNESYGDDASRDYLLVLSKDARDENISSSSSSISTSGNRHAMNYMPYTTARKLNLNSKVTQFYTPTVPTFTTSTRTTTVGAISEDAMVTTKATTINGFISGGTVGSQSFGNQFAHPIRREENYEVLDFSDLSTTTTTMNPTDKETTVVDTTTATPPTTTIDSSVEYNKVSFLPKDTSRKQGKSLSIKFITNSRNELADELKPKTTLVLEDDEQLQRAQSESIVSSQNNRPIYERNKYSVISLHNFRDNPTAGVPSGSLVNQTPIATVQPSANLQQESDGIVPASRTTMSYTVFFDPLTINDELMELEKPKPTEAHTPEIHVVRQYGWNGTLLKPGAASAPNVAEENYSTRLMSENLRENSTLMQKKANEMFGELNDAQADKLMTAIKMADKDKSMRRLILLLIRTCDDTPTSTNEESRKALLEALINIGGVMNTQSADDLRIASDNQPPDTDYRRGKEIGYNRDANLVHAAGSVIKSTTPNMAATTENYAKVSTADANDGSNSKERDSQERLNSEEWLKDNDVQTTEATTKITHREHYADSKPYFGGVG
uniref:Chitin-binding type-2 domain-containing protein n=1 Tax=Anopheles stephensi TaxID=30069 RepID=A0A182YN40_ANOST